MAVSPNIKRKPLSLGESYDIVRTGLGTYIAQDSGDKQLWSWGYNVHGELAQGERIHRSSGVQIPGTNWKEISVGNHHMLGVKDDGTLWAWGHNNHSQLGNCGTNNLSSPTQIPGTNWCFASAAGSSGSLALKTDGSLWTWGHNNWGQLGLTDACCDWSAGVGCCKCVYRCPVQVAGNNWKCAMISCHSVIGLKCDGTLWTWGHNGHGQLGYCCIVCQLPGTRCVPQCLNPSTGCYYPCCSLASCINPPFSSPTQIPGTNWNGIAIGCNTMYATKVDGTLWSWGLDTHGALGLNGACCDRYCPVQIPGTNWIEISARGHGAFARKSDNTLWSWGHGANGQNGVINSCVDLSSPTQIGGTWAYIGKNQHGTYGGKATRADNTLWAWGCNVHGEVGKTPWLALDCGGVYQANDQWGWSHDYSGFSSPTLVAGTGWKCGSTSRHSTAWIKCLA